jgi:Excalibur calcium-binding domain
VRKVFAGLLLMFSLALANPTATALADPPYRNCKEAHADGRYNIPSDDPAYRPALDRDGDGYACEPYKGK